MQFKVGYIADSVNAVINAEKKKLNRNFPSERSRLDQIDGLLQNLSSFDVEFPFQYEPDFKNLNPVLATLNNIICRGLPTRAPLSVERMFEEIGLVIRDDEDDVITYGAASKPLDFRFIFEILHLIEPGLHIDRSNYGGKMGSKLEWEFLRQHPFLKQILQPQRDLKTIDPKMQGGRTVDFCFTLPYLFWNEKEKCHERIGRIFEIDGPHHSLSEYRYYDAYRDDVTQKENFETLRYTEAAIKRLNIDFAAVIGKELYSHYRNNYNRDISQHLSEYSLVFMPFCISRIQKTLLESLIVNPGLLKMERIRIAVVERDFPCAGAAVESLKEHFLNINSLLNEEQKLPLPPLELVVFENNSYVLDQRMHCGARLEDAAYYSKNEFDIIIDHSILRRSGVYVESDYFNPASIKIRSSHYYETAFGQERRVYCSVRLNYRPLVEKMPDASFRPICGIEDNIRYFLQNIFRKTDFREGQLPIISRAIRCMPVIGLLPTGGGKSITYQLPALMQPGLCIVVDPIKSLMEDQVRVLKDNLIDNCDYINSNLSRQEKSRSLLELRYGETQFLFVSPERFVMMEFRDLIHSIDSSKFGLSFMYCVIDEVHCVSEWGHDFRTTYLMLGKNAQKYARTRNGDPVTLIGLTATASFDVLADIERELQINHSDVANALVIMENTIRPELFFRVIDIGRLDRMDALNLEFLNMVSNLIKLNKKTLIEESLVHHRVNFDPELQEGYSILLPDSTGDVIDAEKLTPNDMSTIIFCPVRGRNGHKLGVDRVYDNLASDKKGFFYSNEDEDELTDEVLRNFDDFIHGRTKHMVCTKAFGMGIDKRDVRMTFHFVHAGSLESFVQEAGRAGRDKKIAESCVLASSSVYYKFDVLRFFSSNRNDRNLRNRNTRKSIRNNFEKEFVTNEGAFVEKRFPSLDSCLESINTTDFSLLSRRNERYNLLGYAIQQQIRMKMKELDAEGNHRYISIHRSDRDIHEFFHKNTFKGIETEKCQLYDLFHNKEFLTLGIGTVELDGQSSLIETFVETQHKIFNYDLASKKIFPDNSIEICKKLGLDPDEVSPYFNKKHKELINVHLKYSTDFEDFLFSVEERQLLDLDQLDTSTKEDIRMIYYSDRKSSNDTGRLIYRMHSMGFLEDYVIDYNKGLYKCKFNKFDSMTSYEDRIEEYLRRYLSENSAIKMMEVLRSRITHILMAENILECLYFLSEFAYSEIASKRRRATDEVEFVLNTAIGDEELRSNRFAQNLFIKEQIFFYFNAKYARLSFTIGGENYSLLEDHRNRFMAKEDVLFKYLNVFSLDGNEQNNYKHMIGSCKKIMRSLSDSDSKKEWALRLLKAFSMYSVNNVSYISEANSELELGFDNLYNESMNRERSLEHIEDMFKRYFDELKKNIKPTNASFKDIELIRLKLLLKFQWKGIEHYIQSYNI